MCFSPEVDVAVGMAISVVAVDAVRHCPTRTALPLALLPAWFAIHTFQSALVWCGFRNLIPSWLSEAAEFGYLLFAFAILPAYIPVAVGLIEPVAWRQKAFIGLEVLGLIGGAAYAQALIRGSGNASACNLYIDFSISGVSSYAGYIYPLATLGAALLSSLRPLQIWGASNVVITSSLVLWNQRGLPSLWCFYAAVTSTFIAWFMRQLRQQQERAANVVHS